MTFQDLKRKHDLIQRLVDAIGDKELSVLSKFLRSRINNPESYVTLLGETSSGKTTLLNGLMKQRLLKTSASPTTGAIVEVAFDAQAKFPEYWAINRDATTERLDEDTFTGLSSRPDQMLSRLKLVVPSGEGYSGWRVFDTPGYGSILDEHEEVLREFIPNSDVVVYVIGYKIGLQENDFLFMRSIQELIHENTDVMIVVNRCPATLSGKDRRLEEIRRYGEDLFHRSVPVFTVAGEICDTGTPLPEAADLWQYVSRLIHSQARQQTLTDTLNAYLDDLLARADALIEKREVASATSKKEQEELRSCAAELRKKGYNIINQEILPTFDRLIAEIPRLLTQAKDRIHTDICSYIDEERNAHMEETIAFVSKHALGMAVHREMTEYTRRLMLELDAMNQRVDDYLNEAIADYYHQIELRFATNAELVARFGGGKLAGKAMENGLRQYFAAFGGAGGSGAGVANAAKHLLKKFGDTFGIKFSRETYNALAHVIKKMGFTAKHAIGNVVTVILEVAQVIIDYSTWKVKLKKQVKKGLQDWYCETLDTVTKDLEKLKNENADTLRAIIEEQAAAFEIDGEETVGNLPQLLSLQREIHQKLEEEKL